MKKSINVYVRPKPLEFINNKSILNYIDDQ